MIRKALVLNVGESQCLASAHWLKGLADQNAIHGHVSIDRQVIRGKLVLGRHTRNQRIVRAIEFNGLALVEISQCDENIVSNVELENFPHEM